MISACFPVHNKPDRSIGRLAFRKPVESLGGEFGGVSILQGEQSGIEWEGESDCVALKSLALLVEGGVDE